MSPSSTTAAILVPSFEDAIPCHSLVLLPGLRSTQLAPESKEVQMLPPSTTAASTTPSLEDVILFQFFVLLPGLRSTQCTPESMEVHMFPPKSTAEILVPSAEDAMQYQDFVPPPGLRSVQLPPESEEIQMFPGLTTAASLIPSLEDVIPFHESTPPPGLRSIQLASPVEKAHSTRIGVSRRGNINGKSVLGFRRKVASLTSEPDPRCESTELAEFVKQPQRGGSYTSHVKVTRAYKTGTRLILIPQRPPEITKKQITTSVFYFNQEPCFNHE